MTSDTSQKEEQDSESGYIRGNARTNMVDLTANQTGGIATSAQEVYPKILLVDDEEGIRRFFRRASEVSGFCLDGVASFEEGISALTERPFGENYAQSPINLEKYCGLILDVHLPGGPKKSGWRIAEYSRSAGYKMPIVMISGYSPDPKDVEIIRANNLVYMQKPISVAIFTSLTNIIRTSLKERKKGADERNLHPTFTEM